MSRISLAVIFAMAVLLGQAHAIRNLKQYDAFQRWGGYGDNSRSGFSMYSMIAGRSECDDGRGGFRPCYGYGSQYGYYGTSTAADYFGDSYPARAEVAIARARPAAGVVAARQQARVVRTSSGRPYDV